MKRLTIVAVIAGFGLWWLCSEPAESADAVRVGTFNIRVFPEAGTDADKVGARIAELDADAFAVQEIADLEQFEAVLAAASADSGRWWVMASTHYCAYDRLNLGVVYDASRWQLVGVRDFATPKSCRAGHPTTFLAVLQAADGSRIGVMSTHLQAGDEPRHHRRRRQQWKHLMRSYLEAEADFEVEIALGGDFNSTGWESNHEGERDFIERTLSRAGLYAATGDIDCTMYWRPGNSRAYQPAVLDHILVRPWTPWAAAEPLGMCREHRCKPQDELAEWHTVSDHCPVVSSRSSRPSGI